MTSFLGVPILCAARSSATSTSPTRPTARCSPTSTRSSSSALAAAAGVAIENARLHEQVRARRAARRARAHRPRPPRHVIQRLFATGLSLQAAAQIVDGAGRHRADQRRSRRPRRDDPPDPLDDLRAPQPARPLGSVRSDVLAVCERLPPTRSASSRRATSTVRSTARSTNNVAGTSCCGCARRCPTSPATPGDGCRRHRHRVDGDRLRAPCRRRRRRATTGRSRRASERPRQHAGPSRGARWHVLDRHSPEGGTVVTWDVPLSACPATQH